MNGVKVKVSKVVFMISVPPYRSPLPYSAMKIAKGILKKGVQVTLIFYADGIWCIKKDVGKSSETLPSFGEKLKEFIKNGGRVIGCESALNLYSISPNDVVEGVEIREDFLDLLLDTETKVFWI